MSTLRVLVADDELLGRKRLTRLLGALPDVDLVAAYESAEHVLSHLAGDTVDVLLLDIQMPGLTGLEAAALLPDPSPYVVFCTAYSDHAVEAFERGAVDYLVKPIEAARLKKALDRARERVVARSAAQGSASAPSPSSSSPTSSSAELAANGVRTGRLPVSTRKGIVLLDPAKVSHATIDGELVRLVCGADTYITDLTLNDLEARVPRDRFERVHRRALINLDEVACLEPIETGGYTARMRNGDLVTISRASARELRRRFAL